MLRQFLKEYCSRKYCSHAILSAPFQVEGPSQVTPATIATASSFPLPAHGKTAELGRKMPARLIKVHRSPVTLRTKHQQFSTRIMDSQEPFLFATMVHWAIWPCTERATCTRTAHAQKTCIHVRKEHEKRRALLRALNRSLLLLCTRIRKQKCTTCADAKRAYKTPRPLNQGRQNSMC
jgi:hypothetical protein